MARCPDPGRALRACACGAAFPRSRRSCSPRWASPSARTPRSSASSTPRCCGRCRSRTTIGSRCCTPRTPIARSRGSASRTPIFSTGESDTHSFSGIAAFTPASLTLLAESEPLRFSGSSVTSEYFDVLGARPLLGRLYHANEPDRETSAEIVLTHAFWTRQFAGDSSIVGRASQDRRSDAHGRLACCPRRSTRLRPVWTP